MLMFHHGLDIPRIPCVFWPKQAKLHTPAFLMQALNMGGNIARCLVTDGLARSC